MRTTFDYEFLDFVVARIESIKEDLFHSIKNGDDVSSKPLDETILYTRVAISHINEISNVNPPGIATSLEHTHKNILQNPLNPTYPMNMDEFIALNTAYFIIKGVSQSVDLNVMLNEMDAALHGIGTTVAFLDTKAKKQESFVIDKRMINMIHNSFSSIDMLQRKESVDYGKLLEGLKEIRNEFLDTLRESDNWQDLHIIKVEQVKIIEETEVIISKYFFENDDKFTPIYPKIQGLETGVN